MTILDTLNEAQGLVGRYWKEEQSPEQARILGCARDVLIFISATGQPYRFEDYRERLQAGNPSRLAATTEELVRRAADFFEQLRGESQSERERALALVIIDALHFIDSTGQLDDFKRYSRELDSNEPPRVVASFDTREQAEAWLRNHPSPPHCASILIAGRYHTVAYDRETNGRYLPPSRELEYYLASLEQDSPPAAVASFDTLQEAEAWLSAQPAPPRRAWVRISGEVYLAVYHPNVNHRALYPLSLADGFEINTDVEPGSA
ncbi:MAG TPA: hypothetical protein VFZ09_08605 [Archangium sp.]|uniref:hypothetical protein n=1 Tax=Archangium sp. TaxID=1872627 RepID=UPI002E34DFBF|nr:hypothetical protein [Archangium sp.]HEX5746291.1 hypothetical protein [Archangium sp.]